MRKLDGRNLMSSFMLVAAMALSTAAYADKEPHNTKASDSPASKTAGHGGNQDAAEVRSQVGKVPEQVLFDINAAYLKSVKPIFKVSCFNCHSSQTEFPWYSKLPGAKQLIEKDIRESKEHLDITNDFPFGGHGEGSTDDLQAIRDTVVSSDMPPFRYWIMHPSSRLNDEDKKAVTDWVDQSLEKLKSAMGASKQNNNSKPVGH